MQANEPRKRIVLTPAQLADIVAEKDVGKAFTKLWYVLIPDMDSLPTDAKINPGDYEIPVGQATEIMRGRESFEQMGGLWLNLGPMTYEG